MSSLAARSVSRTGTVRPAACSLMDLDCSQVAVASRSGAAREYSSIGFRQPHTLLPSGATSRRIPQWAQQPSARRPSRFFLRRWRSDKRPRCRRRLIRFKPSLTRSRWNGESLPRLLVSRSFQVAGSQRTRSANMAAVSSGVETVAGNKVAMLTWL